MKYEAVFGDQALLEDAGTFTGLDVFTRNVTTGLYGCCRHEDLTYDYLRENPVIAMRRLIAEPKRWTVEDQKAGRLPEVGCFVEYFKNNKHGNTEVTAQWRNGDELEILRHQNKNKAFVVFNARTEESSDLIVQCMKPIETPEEKAARLRSEWCIKALSSCSILSEMQKYELKRLGGYIEDIYDALLSGDLPVPVKE